MANTVRTSGAYTLEPGSAVVTLKNGLLFTPVAFANLPSSPAMGMVAFLTTDGAGATKTNFVITKLQTTDGTTSLMTVPWQHHRTVDEIQGNRHQHKSNTGCRR